jgi:hypothetical protein
MAGKSHTPPEVDADGQFRAITPEIADLVGRLRWFMLVLRMNIMDEDPPRLSKRMDKPLIKAAFMIHDEKIAAEEYAWRAAQVALTIGAPIQPTILISPRIKAEVMQRRESFNQRDRNWLEFQVEDFAFYIKLYGIRDLITGEWLHFCSAFRYALALRFEPDLAPQYKEDAELQALYSPTMRALIAKARAS